MLKEKEGLFQGIHKFAPRKKVGMLLLCAVSLAVCLWVLFVDKGEDAQELNPSIINRLFPLEAGQKDNSTNIESVERTNVGQSALAVQPPPPPVYFKGYSLPPGNPCEGFTLPPPPADKKITGPRPCPVCYLPVEQAIALMPDAPSFSPVVSNLTYIHEENSGRPEFGGHPSLMQRNDSYDVRESMSVHCGFVKGIRPGYQTGFDIDDSDLHEMESCRGVVVASAIFGTDLSVHVLMRFLLNLLAVICNKYILGQALLI